LKIGHQVGFDNPSNIERIRFDYTISGRNLDTTDIAHMDYVRLVHIDEPELIETDTNFYLSSSENTYNYAVYSDSSYLGTLSDLDVLLKNNTVGNHNLTYVLYSASEKKAYLEETYQYAYTVEPAAFTVSLQSFYLSDIYVNTYVTSNYDGSYIVYEDGNPMDSGTLHKEGTTIITNRDLTPGASINYTIAFTSGSETVIQQLLLLGIQTKIQ